MGAEIFFKIITGILQKFKVLRILEFLFSWETETGFRVMQNSGQLDR